MILSKRTTCPVQCKSVRNIKFSLVIFKLLKCLKCFEKTAPNILTALHLLLLLHILLVCIEMDGAARGERLAMVPTVDRNLGVEQCPNNSETGEKEGEGAAPADQDGGDGGEPSAVYNFIFIH